MRLSIAYFSSNFSVISVKNRPKAAFILINKELKSSSIVIKRDLIIVSVYWNKERYFVILGSFPPFEPIMDIINDFHNFLINHINEKIIIMHDLNAKSELWGRSKIDNRDQEVIELINRNEIDILSDPYGSPTLNSSTGIS